MSNNNERFKLAYGTPLMTGSTLNTDLGFLGNTKSAEKILNGTYNFPPGTDTHTIQLLRCIGQVAQCISHNPINVRISTED